MRNNQIHFKDHSANEILELAAVFRKSKILLTACEIGIFTLLENNHQTSKEIAYELNSDERATDRLLASLCILDLIYKENENYKNTPSTSKFLVKSSDHYLGDMKHFSQLWDTWGELTEVIYKGSALSNKPVSEKSPEWIESYMDSLHSSYKHEAKEIVSYIKLKNVTNVFEVGCGSGLNIIEFLKENPNLNITAIDYNEVIIQTKKNLANENIVDKVKLIGGDIFDYKIEDKYDLIFISFVLDEYSIWDNVNIMTKCYRALNKGGMLVIHDNIIDENRISPEHSVLYSINMLLNTNKGDTYTETDFWIMLRESGFHNIKRIDTEVGTSLMFAEKTTIL
ncbi:MAG: class I SAM-dependent methyltransferase [Candidatus Kapabacteria bacterium]|nr:class I SAM-dependent methyltransferase [Candidatus Kapabacteria bacterium]